MRIGHVTLHKRAACGGQSADFLFLMIRYRYFRALLYCSPLFCSSHRFRQQTIARSSNHEKYDKGFHSLVKPDRLLPPPIRPWPTSRVATNRPKRARDPRRKQSRRELRRMFARCARLYAWAPLVSFEHARATAAEKFEMPSQCADWELRIGDWLAFVY